MPYQFRLLDSHSGAVVATVRVIAESRAEAEELGRRKLAQLWPTRYFWESEGLPPGSLHSVQARSA